MCVILVHTLRKVFIENNKLIKNETFNISIKHNSNINKNVNINGFQEDALRNIIYNFYTNYKKVPCIMSLLLVLKNEHPVLEFNTLHFNREMQRTILKGMSLDGNRQSIIKTFC